MKLSPEPAILSATCSCPKGKGQGCGHVTGLLYQLANYKMLKMAAVPEDVVKTSLPMTWHQPRGLKIKGTEVQKVSVVGYGNNGTAAARCAEERRNVSSTLFNPVRGDFPMLHDLKEVLTDIKSPALVVTSLDQQSLPLVATKFGSFPQGSLLAVQQRLHSDYHIFVFDGVTFPLLPVEDKMVNSYQYVLDQKKQVSLEGLYLSEQEIHEFEEKTRLQSDSPLWHKLRSHRITTSKMHNVYIRQKDTEGLLVQMKSTRRVQTAAMKAGLENEPIAAENYAKLIANHINLYPSGIIISQSAPWLAVSPDRRVYDPERVPPFGLLEIKCPQVSTVLEVKYLKLENDVRKLKRTHQYYTKIQAQLAVTGLNWCDLFVWCEQDCHKESITFDPVFWQNVKNKIDAFFFDFFL